MKLTKIETNLKRNLYLNVTGDINFNVSSMHIENNVINIYPEIKYQSIIGFGGAITEASAYVLSNVSEELCNKIMDEYFGENSLNYSICRLPIGSSDFSTHSYSYCSNEDLSDFNISEDEHCIIPIVKKAQNRFSGLRLLSTPWSPPKFMKNNKNLYNGGKLLNEYAQLWAEYFAKYILEYQKHNIHIDYVTIQNEPQASQSWESCLYSASEEAEFAAKYLFPTLKENNLDTKIIVWDHNKENLLNRALATITNNEINNSIAGFAFHWYTGTHFENIELVNNLFPNKLLIHSEGCTGFSNYKKSDELFNAEMYASEIIGDFNSGTHAFIDWNIVLDYNGGPNHKKNNCNAPIMISKNEKDYNKTPTFYYISQFAKYIKPGATRIAFSRFTENINVTAFKNIDNSVVVVLLNKNNFNTEYNLCYKGFFFHDNIDSHAIVTFIINGDEDK